MACGAFVSTIVFEVVGLEDAQLLLFEVVDLEDEQLLLFEVVLDLEDEQLMFLVIAFFVVEDACSCCGVELLVANTTAFMTM
jgi:hypothetical protein